MLSGERVALSVLKPSVRRQDEGRVARPSACFTARHPGAHLANLRRTEWIASVGDAIRKYHGASGARVIEQLRLNATELRMAPLEDAVHIGLEPCLGVLMQGRARIDAAPLQHGIGDTIRLETDTKVRWGSSP